MIFSVDYYSLRLSLLLSLFFCLYSYGMMTFMSLFFISLSSYNEVIAWT